MKCVCVCVRGILCLSVADGKWNETEIRRPFGLLAFGLGLFFLLVQVKRWLLFQRRGLGTELVNPQGKGEELCGRHLLLGRSQVKEVEEQVLATQRPQQVGQI